MKHNWNWIYFILSEIFIFMIYSLLWVTGWNPILIIGMLLSDQMLFICINSIVLSLITMAIAYYMLDWNRLLIWLLSLFGIISISFVIAEPFFLFCNNLCKENISIELQTLLFNVCIQFLYISLYINLNKISILK